MTTELGILIFGTLMLIAVFSVYRTSSVQPKKKLRSLLEFESGSNDPMAVLMTTSILGIMTGGGGSSPVAIVGTLLAQFIYGGLTLVPAAKWLKVTES